METIRAAIDAGIAVIDTADFYGNGHNEWLIRQALRDGDRERVVISDKFGGLRDPAGRFIGLDARPVHVKSALAYSLQRLGTDYIDVYRPARLDPAVPIEDTVGAIAEMVEAGWVRHIGLSEVGVETIRRACAVHPIVDLQIEYSLFSRGVERSILGVCRELGVGITAYGVLAHGLLTGAYAGGGEVGHLPWFHGDNLGANLALVERLRVVAEARGVTVAQLAVAWVLAQGDDIVALVGASRPGRIADAVVAGGLVLSGAELAAIEAAVPVGAVAGTRYAAPLMALLDSER
ncbi:aldo/keto reductase [Umezawaea sp. NPDC059074]|uniref:aldo/keto reductase n=1 Tax=Umezawaea sp. NPDC059074 TaxID=3346716 RepID=UPI00368057D9